MTMPTGVQPLYVRVISKVPAFLAKLTRCFCIKPDVRDAASSVRKHGSQPSRDTIQFSENDFTDAPKAVVLGMFCWT